jgi:hypothetical protein
MGVVTLRGIRGRFLTEEAAQESNRAVHHEAIYSTSRQSADEDDEDEAGVREEAERRGSDDGKINGRCDIPTERLAAVDVISGTVSHRRRRRRRPSLIRPGRPQPDAFAYCTRNNMGNISS